MSAEHYTWVATGDKGNPDATTVSARAEAFLERLSVLFDQGMILTLPDTYTGVTLKFLKKTYVYKVGTSVQTIGIGDWERDEAARGIINQALRRVLTVVANIQEYMKLYRPAHSWLHAFTAFRFPSPFSAAASAAAASAGAASAGAASAGGSARAEASASIRRICREAELLGAEAGSQLLKTLPRADKFYSDGADPRSAWGRASSEWP